MATTQEITFRDTPSRIAAADAKHLGETEAQLATHALDVVISDAPAPPHLHVKVFSHLLGESGTTFFAVSALARKVRRGFPQSLHDVPMLLPTSATVLRHALEQWFDHLHIRPRVAGEFEDEHEDANHSTKSDLSVFRDIHASFDPDC